MGHREGGLRNHNPSTQKLLHKQNTCNDLHEKRTSPGQTIYRNDRQCRNLPTKSSYYLPWLHKPIKLYKNTTPPALQ